MDKSTFQQNQLCVPKANESFSGSGAIQIFINTRNDDEIDPLTFYESEQGSGLFLFLAEPG